MVECQLPKLSARVRFPSLAPACLGILIFLVSGCATRELPSEVSAPSKITSRAPVPVVGSAAPKKGTYHKVQKGQTIWRIAQAYNVSIGEIIKSNNIPNVAKVEENQLLLIPGADSVRSIAAEEADTDKKEFIWPIKGKVVGYFGERKGNLLNKGIRIQANSGDVVCAARSGRVVFADSLTGYGPTVIVDHEDGFFSVYAQNASLMVGFDDRVSQGTPLARPVNGVGPLAFVHFEIRKHAVAENPLYYLP